jgi:dUTP pyrophosphatase
MFRAGTVVAEHLAPVADRQVQPNGVDLTLDAVYEQVAPGRIDRSGKTVGDRRELSPTVVDGTAERERAAADGDGDEARGAGRADAAEAYRLPPGGYVVQYAETIRVPDDHVGFVYPRSSLLRNSCMLNTAVWDAGYEGRGEGLLQVHHPVELEPGCRVAQFVLAEATHDDTYDGSYQGERLD